MSLVYLVLVVFLLHENLTNQLQIQLSFSQWGKGSELFRNLPEVLSSLILWGMWCLVTKLCSTLATSWTVARQAPLSIGFSRQEYWSGLPFPSPGIFLTQELNLGLLHFRQSLYQLSYEGSPLDDGASFKFTLTHGGIFGHICDHTLGLTFLGDNLRT